MECSNVEFIKVQIKKISNTIFNWINEKENFLNVVSSPYNTSCIFVTSILEFLRVNKNILYITNEIEPEIISIINKDKSIKFYIYLDDNKIYAKEKFVITNYCNAIKIKEKFDLVIYDDIRSFPMYSKFEIVNLISKYCKDNSKIIVYSIEEVFNKCRTIAMVENDLNMPLIEPRIILTRIDVNKDIPYIVYEYLKWSINLNRNVIIYASNPERVKGVYTHLNNLREDLTNNISYYIKGQCNKEVISNFRDNKRCIIVTNTFEEVSNRCTDIDVLVYVYGGGINYKKLVYFSGKASIRNKERRGEVIFLAKEESMEIEKAKNTLRNFNRKAWEKGLLNL